MIKELAEHEVLGILIFFIIILVGMTLVSVHYRRSYEEIKEKLKIIVGNQELNRTEGGS